MESLAPFFFWLSLFLHPRTIKLYRKRNLITWQKVALVSTIKRIQLKFVQHWKQHSSEGLFVEVEFDLSQRESSIGWVGGWMVVGGASDWFR